MKILRLDLRAFGRFTGVSIDLAAGTEGFHLIYGPNEAGKSSSLRALRNLLYGIPNNSQDNFLHAYPAMRIGATLARRDGQCLEFVRRKGTKGTLLTADEKETMDEAVLRDFLGGCDQVQFQTMFGIDRGDLIAGGKDILDGHGEIGHVLFAAGAGISDLRTFRTNLEKQAEDLFKPGGSKPDVNQSLSKLANARKLVRESQLPSSEWQKHKVALDDATKRLDELEQELDRLSQKKSRLQRIRGALPVIGRLNQAKRDLDALGDVPALAESFPETRLDTISRMEAARQVESDAQAEIARLDAEIGAIRIPAELIAREAEIETLYKTLSVHRKAQQDLPALIDRRCRLENEATAILQEMRPDLTLDEVGQLKLAKRQQVEVQELGSKLAALENDLTQAKSAIADAQMRLEEIKDELAQLPLSHDPAPLADAVRMARAKGNLASQAGSLRAELASLEAQAAVDLQRFLLWSGSLDSIENLPLPSAETIARFDSTLTEANAAVVRWQDQLDKARDDSNDLTRQLEQLRLEGEVPSESDLAKARDDREMLWRRIRNDWLERKVAEAPEAEPAKIADAFENSLRDTDDLADRLRREATRVASRAALQARLNSVLEHSAECAKKLTEAANRHREIQQAWRDSWTPLEIDPLPPREMQAWTQRHQALVLRAQAIREKKSELAQLGEEIEKHSRQLRQCLADISIMTEAASLDALILRAESELDAARNTSDARRQLEKESSRIVKATSQAETKEQQAASELAKWRTRWAAAIAPLGLPAESSPAIAGSVVAQSVELFNKLHEVAVYNERIDAINEDAKGFYRDAKRLLAAVGTEADLKATQLEPATEDLYARLRRALSDRKNLDILQSDRKKQDEKRAKHYEIAQKMEMQLGSLCKEARCATAEELPNVEVRSSHARRLRRECESFQSQLSELAGSGTVEALINEATVITADSLPGELQRIDESIAELQRERGELNQTKGGEKAVLARMDSSAVAAEAAEDTQEILTRLESDSWRYIRLRLASAVLREGIERYRKKNEGPVLGRASKLFRRLTLGSFDALRIGFNDGGDQVVEGVRPDGRALPPGHMSEGTCDQLYLALRLASLENWLQRNEPLPLIVDDILVSFDNDRAAATLEVLAEVSQQTQVIFFSHHEHLVDLARRSISADMLFVHWL